MTFLPRIRVVLKISGSKPPKKSLYKATLILTFFFIPAATFLHRFFGLLHMYTCKYIMANRCVCVCVHIVYIYILYIHRKYVYAHPPRTYQDSISTGIYQENSFFIFSNLSTSAMVSEHDSIPWNRKRRLLKENAASRLQSVLKRRCFRNKELYAW